METTTQPQLPTLSTEERFKLAAELNLCFVWDKTKEGHCFWSDCYHYLLCHDKNHTCLSDPEFLRILNDPETYKP